MISTGEINVPPEDVQMAQINEERPLEMQETVQVIVNPNVESFQNINVPNTAEEEDGLEEQKVLQRHAESQRMSLEMPPTLE